MTWKLYMGEVHSFTLSKGILIKSFFTLEICGRECHFNESFSPVTLITLNIKKIKKIKNLAQHLKSSNFSHPQLHFLSSLFYIWLCTPVYGPEFFFTSVWTQQRIPGLYRWSYESTVTMVGFHYGHMYYTRDGWFSVCIASGEPKNEKTVFLLWSASTFIWKMLKCWIGSLVNYQEK